MIKAVVTGTAQSAVKSRSAGGVVATQRVVNGDFSSATGWTQGTGWVIAGGIATGTSATGMLTNTLSSPINVGDSVTWSLNILTNPAGDGIAVQLFNSGNSQTQFLTAGVLTTGVTGGTVTANANGPFDKIRIQDLDFSGTVTLDDLSAVA